VYSVCRERYSTIPALGMAMVLAFGLFPNVEALESTEDGSTVSQPKQFFVQLLPVRDGFPENMTDDEERIMSEHFEYLKNLTRQGKVLMAGPCFDPTFGLVVLETGTQEEAAALIDNDPSVIEGVNTYKMQQMRVSLMANHVPAVRYVVEPSDRVMKKEIEVTSSLQSVWRDWTTTEGVQSFFADHAHVELRPGGPFEIYFNQNAPEGQRGSEGCRILSYLPMTMLTFEWNAPPSFGDLRYEYTRVIIVFAEMPEGKVKLSLSHLGWGHGEKWNELYEYFDRAWDYVLSSFAQHCDQQ